MENKQGFQPVGYVAGIAVTKQKRHFGIAGDKPPAELYSVGSFKIDWMEIQPYTVRCRDQTFGWKIDEVRLEKEQQQREHEVDSQRNHQDVQKKGEQTGLRHVLVPE